MLRAKRPPGHPTPCPKSCSASRGDPRCRVLAGLDHYLAPSPFLLASPPPCDEGGGKLGWVPRGCGGNGAEGSKELLHKPRRAAWGREGKGTGRSGERRALNNFISRGRAAGRPLRTAGLLPGCCRAALWLMRHLLRLTARICCRSPPPAKLPAAAARRARPPLQPGAPRRATCAAPGTPEAGSGHATRRG